MNSISFHPTSSFPSTSLKQRGSQLKKRWLREAETILAFSLLVLAPCALAQSILQIDNPAKINSTQEIKLAADIFAGNEYVQIPYFDDHLWPADYRTPKGRNFSLLDARAALSATYEKFEVKFFRRAQWSLNALSDTAHLYYISQTDQIINSGRTLEINYQIQGFELDGVRLAGAWPIALPLLDGKTQLGVGVNRLRGQLLRLEQASGIYSSNGQSVSMGGQRELWYSNLEAGKQKGLEISIDYFTPYTAESFPETGSGYSFDFGIQHHFENGSELNLAVNDLYGHLRWNNLPHIQQDIAIDALSADDYISKGPPAISGYNDYRDLHMVLPAKYLFSFNMPLSQEWQGFGELTRLSGHNFPRLGIIWQPAKQFSLLIDHDLYWKTWGIYGQWGTLHAGLRSDNLRPQESRAFGASLGINYHF